MNLRQKVILFAITPLIVSLCALGLFVQHQANALARQQRATIQQAILASKEAELSHYVALASRSIAHLYDSGRNDAATLLEARRILATLSYGSDGYFFVYDFQGNNIVHPRQPELEGRNLWELRDVNGVPTVQRLLARARAGGGLERYIWAKPSSSKPAPKLGYVIPLQRWGWMLGTGIYLDDVDAALARIDAQQSHNIQVTMVWIVALAILATLVVAGSGLALNVSELRVADAKLRALAQRVVDSQEQERARLSRDLHDGISQTLVSIKLQIEAGLIRLGGDAAQQQKARAGFEHTAAQLGDVLAEVRRISHDLRPAILDDLGLAAALDHLAHEVSQTSAAPARFTADGVADDLSDVVNTVLFRIAQEALTNIERHAEAGHIDITLVRHGNTVTLSIVDDGHGFDADGIAGHPQRGIGLRNMMERMDAIGGELRITSTGAGTVVTAVVPLHGSLARPAPCPDPGPS